MDDRVIDDIGEASVNAQSKLIVSFFTTASLALKVALDTSVDRLYGNSIPPILLGE